jgi:16S rRNA (adenine1518-N6/adenine1519-N6)-dimethyltransferase
VLVQLAARRTGFHPVARTVFRPPPNVDSALVAFRRVPLPSGFARIKAIVEMSFAHRRKTLPNSLALSELVPRERAAAALAAIGRPPETRAEALAPEEFVALAHALDGPDAEPEEA